MGSAQYLLILGGLILFTTLILNQSKSSQQQTDSSINNEGIVIATSIGQSIIEKLEIMSFDEKTISSEIEDADSLTLAYSLGAEYGENDITLYDDIDDFNNITLIDTNNRLGEFETSIEVFYVAESALENLSTTRTFLKKARINVSNEYLLDTLKLEYIFGY